MNFSICSFASGSSGNCYAVRSEESAILIDVGISGKRVFEGLDSIGIDREQIQGILITHEHTDHVKGLRIVTKKNPNWTVFSNEETGYRIADCVSSGNLVTFTNGDAFLIGDIKVKPISISHDAANPVGYSLFHRGMQITLLTDSGFVNQEMQEALATADIIVLEANHDVNMLKMGRYPWSLKQRVLGYNGHLSNEVAAEALVQSLNVDGKFRRVYLAHLSKENNFPQLAFQTVKNILEESDYYIGKHLSLQVFERDKPSDIFEI